MTRPRVLIIAGLDPCGGAGLAADIRTISALGGYPMPVLSAVTVQNTCAVHSVQPLAPDLVAAQIRAVCADIAPDAVKVGMLADPAIVEAVAEVLAALTGVPIVVDPVLAAGSGDPLAIAPLGPALVTHLLPVATVATPNAPELATLTGRSVTTEAELESAACALLARTGAAAVYAKAGHLSGAMHRDILIRRDGGRTAYEAPHLDTRAGHGTGCVLASALACELGIGRSFEEAAQHAHAFVQQALRHADLSLGRGTPPVDPLWRMGEP